MSDAKESVPVNTAQDPVLAQPRGENLARFDYVIRNVLTSLRLFCCLSFVLICFFTTSTLLAPYRVRLSNLKTWQNVLRHRKRVLLSKGLGRRSQRPTISNSQSRRQMTRDKKHLSAL